jgi:hypothetical protein
MHEITAAARSGHELFAFLESRAKERGLTLEQYLNDVAQGKYSAPSTSEVRKLSRRESGK